MREGTPTSVFLSLDTIARLALSLVVKFIRRENPLKFADVKKISKVTVAICTLLGLTLALFSNSLLNIDSLKESTGAIGGSIDWIIGGNIFLVVIVTFINSAYKEFCFRGLAFNEMRIHIPVVAALIVQAMFYAGELVYFKNPMAAILYAFLGQLVFGIIFYLGRSIWASFIAQISCSLGLALLRRTDLSNLFNNSSSIVLLIVSIVIIGILIVAMNKSNKRQQVATNTAV